MAEYKMVRLGDVCEQINGVSYKPADVYDSLTEKTTILLRANNIFEDKLNYDELVFVDKKRISENQYMKKGDILICASSGSKHLVGKAACLTEDKDLTFGAFCKVLRPKTVNPEYIKHYFFSPSYRTEISRLSEGANINNIKAADLDNLKIPLPSESIQNKIAKQLDKCVKIINNQKKALEKYDTLIKSRFIEMFGDILAGKYKFETRKLGEISEVGSSHRVFTTEFVEHGIPFYRGTEIGELANGKIPQKPYYISEEHYQRLIAQDSKPQIGDLLMPSICNKGQVWMVDTEEPFYYKDGRVLSISPNREIYNSKYLQYFMREKTLVEYPKLGSGSTFAEFKIFLLKDIDILTPPLSLQNDFASFVQQIDKSKFEIANSLKRLYNKGMLS